MSKEENKVPRDNSPSYLKYIGLSFQMIAVIGLGTWLGWEIQQKSQMNFPVWLLTFCFLSIAVSFYQLFISLKNDEKEQQKNKKP
ncbi:hypothetical protein P872_07070 [Rhodonellum psychrophilum GCM71 = DSM 17998]|uniref:F0F1-ATPase subunit n=2 Tax=Rhodonellum TaxID=336827 RepID=U5C172_9BACT|nr:MULTISPECIES: AtpZ/AtpI family protein [Rhodonellum]ERM81892.1 hypothetical protein P872_07070 [Rhodonellum psychrophilum GCM71 = DSM 17998]MDO9553641.1 AtpZ/AtpI family protein [Rhodonellum sp.]SDY68098.1 Putative F0F1-ATPase subunit Ca2+/Mg2+ transporter [Rhodonellum ikkaensis]